MIEERPSTERPRRIAVIDIGSNPARMVVFQIHGEAYLDALAEQIADRKAGRKAGRRPRISGMNPDRADSIAGGALAVHEAAEWLGAADVTISSRGLREGVALDLAAAGVPRQVRSVSLATLAARFTTWDPASRTRRAVIASRLLEALRPEARAELQEMPEHAAGIVTAGDLGGFSHEDLGLLSAILRQANDARVSARTGRSSPRPTDSRCCRRRPSCPSRTR